MWQDGQQVLIKQSWVHVHPCRVILQEESTDITDNDDDRDNIDVRVNETTNETDSRDGNEWRLRLEKGAVLKVGLQNEDRWSEANK